MINATQPHSEGQTGVYLTKNLFAYYELRSRILDGTYPPNHRLKLKDIADDLNTSMMPVREALRQLEESGLVQQVPHQGYTVSPLSSFEMEELFSLRMSLEVLTVRTVIERCSAADVEKLCAELETSVEQMRAYVRETQRNPDAAKGSLSTRKRFMAINRDFHFRIVRATGYQHLNSILENLFDMSERYMNLLEFVVGLDDTDVEEHKKIANGIRNGDAAATVDSVRQHIGRVVATLHDFAKQSGWMDTETPGQSEGGR